jgi:hypothetical protein
VDQSNELKDLTINACSTSFQKNNNPCKQVEDNKDIDQVQSTKHQVEEVYVTLRSGKILISNTIRKLKISKKGGST